MTINATAMWLLALYETAALEQAGVEPDGPAAADVRGQLAGTTQNDIVKEYLSRGTYAFPPAASMRLTTDLIAYTVTERPALEPDQHLQLPPAGGRRDAGAGDRVRDVAPRSRCSTRCATPGRCRPSGSPRWSPGSRSSSTPACGSSRRCARCARFVALWDEVTRDRYGVTDAKARRLRYGVQVNSLGLTEAQPENNVQRIVLEMLGGHAVEGRPGPRGAAARVERGARPAATLGPAVVAAHPAGARVRVRPAGVRRPVRGVARRRGQGRRADRTPPAPRWPASRSWAARSRPSRTAT